MGMEGRVPETDRCREQKPRSPQQKFLQTHRRIGCPNKRLNRAAMIQNDGHVEPENLNRAFTPSDEYLALWNTDNLPHRSELQN
jgi:hypothetical protein